MGQFLIPVRYHGRGQGYQIGLEFEPPSQHMIGDLNRHRTVNDPHNGFVGQ